MDTAGSASSPEASPDKSPAAKTPTPKAPLRRRIRRFLFRVWLPIVALFVAYLFISYRATGFDPGVLASDQQIQVDETADSITFIPKNASRHAGLIFIPGSMVEPTAYAPLARTIAEAGYRTIIIKIPFRSAPFQSQRDRVIRQAETIAASDSATRWIVAGHSFGGVLACQVAHDSPKQLVGLVLLGTSHPRDVDLSNSALDITKIVASNDGLASPDRVKANAAKLPPQTHWIMIPGGNHAQFGYYGFQLGDHRATISRQAQQAIVSTTILDALTRVSSN